MTEEPADNETSKVVSRDTKDILITLFFLNFGKTGQPKVCVYGGQHKPEEPVDKGEAAKGGSRLQMQGHTAELLSKGCQAGGVQHLALIQKHLLCYGQQDHCLWELLGGPCAGGGWLPC